MDLSKLWDETFKSEKKAIKKASDATIRVYDIKQSFLKEKSLIKNLATFESVRTASTCKLKVLKNGKQVTYLYMETERTDYFLILLNKLKKEIRARETIVMQSKYSANPKNTKYFYFAKEFKTVKADAGSVYKLNNVYEADISHAYYRAAYILGFISKELYNEIIKNCTKDERLKLLGSIATVKVFQQYEVGELINGEVKKDDLLRDAWFKICNYVDVCLLELRDNLGDNFLFYWVDGIYFKYTDKVKDLENADFFKKIREVKYKYDVEFKIVPLLEFELLNCENFVEIKITKTDGTIKRFFPDKTNIKSYSLVGLEDLKNS